MGVALFVALERDIDGLDHFMSGKALAKAPVHEEEGEGDDNLAVVARSLGVTPLHEFHSIDREQLIGLMFEGDPDEAPESVRSRAPETEWFSASDGLATAHALLGYLKSHPGYLQLSERELRRYEAGWNFQEAVEADLEDIVRILERAESEGVRWYLALDF